MDFGYWNRVLRVDLTTCRIWSETVSSETWRAIIGGAGYGAKVLLDETDASTDALGADNPLIFALGPYQTGATPGNAKWTVTAKSPLTNTYADSAGGADWGVALKRAGYDAIVVKGISPNPVYLAVDDGQASIKDATDVWGLDSFQTVEAICAREQGKRHAVVCIGQAGENLVRIACIVADAHSFAGRCGLGAVMGSKRLKAIAVRGSRSAPVFDSTEVKRLSRMWSRSIYDATRANGMREHGTPGLCITAEALGDMPIKYWSGDVWPDGAKMIGAPNYTDVLQARPVPCAHCPVGCHRDVEVAEPSAYSMKGPGPEYETLGMLGSSLLIDDVKAIAKANDTANRLGVDTISVGACIGLAMECYEKGWLTASETGMDLSWGNADSAIELIRQIGERRGFGKLFADGALQAARRIHPEAEKSVAHVKGLDLPAHDARACYSLGVNYATSTRGACHMRGVTEDVEMGGFVIPEIGIVKGWSRFFEPENKAELAVKLQDYCAWLNSLVMCAFMVNGGEMTMTGVIELVNAITGWRLGIEDVMKAGERIFTLQRLINVRDGYDRSKDTLPLKMAIPASQGFRAGKTPTPIDMYLDEYYRLRGWDERGIPTNECLERLGLTAYAGLILG